MSRGVLGWDRTATFLLALLLVALGAAAALWGTGQLSRVWAGAPAELSTSSLSAAYDASWWRAVSATAGLVATLLGLRWLLAHLPRTHAAPLRLPGSGPAGRSTLDGSSAVTAAAEVLGEAPGVTAASGRLKQTRGQVVAEMSLTAGPGADLAAISARIDAVSADLAQVLSRDDVRTRVRVRTARKDRPGPRAR